MTSSIAVDDLIAQIYQGTLEPLPWQSFMKGLREHLGCAAAAMMLQRRQLGVPPIFIYDREVPLSKEEQRQIAIDQLRLTHVDPLGKALREPGDIFTLSEVIAPAELAESQYYQIMMRPYGIEYQLGMCVSEPNGWHCNVGVMNGKDRHDFGAAEKQLFLKLQPHLERALTIYALLSRNELEKEIYRDVANHLRIGTIVLNAAGQVIESNEVAQAIAKDRRYLSLTNGRIVFSIRRCAQEFERIVSDITRPRPNPATTADTYALRIEGIDGSTLGGLVRPAPVLPWFRGESSPSVIVYLADVQHQQFAQEEIVAQLFNLTRSEARLAMLLANGATLVEAAQQLNLTEGSVRVYSKRIFQKTGVNRQAELVRLLLKSVALLAEPDSSTSRYAAKNH